MEKQPPLIEIRDATVWRDTSCVFEKLNLTIQQGESVAIIGPNGSGKTTLSKLFAREIYPVDEPNSSMRILGRRRLVVTDYRRTIGVVANDGCDLFAPATTVYEACVSGFSATAGVRNMPFTPTAAQRRQAFQALADCGIRDLANLQIGKLSTGQRQRCLLARALVHEPLALLLDEPGFGLDLAASLALTSRLRRLIRGGTSVILITHNINDIPPEIDRVISLSAGRIVDDGTRESVLTEDKLAALYKVPLKISTSNGFFVVVAD